MPKPRGECQVCERTMHLCKDGGLGHHGYRRPGWGEIVGDCYGVGGKPFPETDKLERWVPQVRESLAYLTKRLGELETATTITLWETNYKAAYVGGGRNARRPQHEVIYTKPTAEETAELARLIAADYAEGWIKLHDAKQKWEAKFRECRYQLDSGKRRCESELARLLDRIAKGRELRGAEPWQEPTPEAKAPAPAPKPKTKAEKLAARIAELGDNSTMNDW